MEDLFYLALVFVMFAAFVGLVRLCHRIVGIEPDTDGLSADYRVSEGGR